MIQRREKLKCGKHRTKRQQKKTDKQTICFEPSAYDRICDIPM